MPHGTVNKGFAAPGEQLLWRSEPSTAAAGENDYSVRSNLFHYA
jgi:hypothetical protein